MMAADAEHVRSNAVSVRSFARSRPRGLLHQVVGTLRAEKM